MIRRVDLMFVGISFNQFSVDVMLDAGRCPQNTMCYPFIDMINAFGNMSCKIALKNTFLVYVAMKYKLSIKILKYIDLKKLSFRSYSFGTVQICALFQILAQVGAW